MRTIEMDDAMYRKFLQAVDPRHLELRLFATEKCNFRCVYCYESFELGRMSPEVRTGVKNLMTERVRGGLKSLYISWFGGEPLMELDVIEEIESHRIELMKNHPSVRSAASGITTNGYLLTPQVMSKLVGLGVKRYQITLDGPRDHHDRTRLRADGAGTFDVVFEHLRQASLSDLDFSVDIRMHLHEANVEAVRRELTPLLIEHFAADKRFSLHPISVGDFGGAFEQGKVRTTSYADASAARAAIIDEFTTARSAALAHEAPGIETSAGDAEHSGPLSEGAAEVCYAAATNSFAIRSDGAIVKCTTALDDPRNRIGRVTESGALEIDAELVKLWMVGFQSGRPSELACPLYKVKSLDLPHNKVIEIRAY